jgi:hypothetical protein
LIAAAAEISGIELVHYDRDYDLIRRGHRPASGLGAASRKSLTSMNQDPD